MGKIYSKVSDRKVSKHVYTWETYMEVEVPTDHEGRRCHIHHLDGNHQNNDILNLVCMTPSEHLKHHKKNVSLSEEHKKKISETSKGTKRSEDHKKNMGESRKGEKNPFFGKHLSEEHKKKISETLKNKNRGDYV